MRSLMLDVVDVIKEVLVIVWELLRAAMPIKGCFENLAREKKRLKLLKSVNSKKMFPLHADLLRGFECEWMGIRI